MGVPVRVWPRAPYNVIAKCMKVFDCTTFFNENLMLEIRFNILNKFVDKFVIAEAKYSHSGEKKKLNFDINKFSEFKKKNHLFNC